MEIEKGYTEKEYNELNDFDQVANAYVAKLDGEENKLTYAILKVSIGLKRMREKINDKITKVNIKHCLVDESKKEKPIMKDQHKDLCFSKEGREACNVELTDTILGETKYKIKHYYATQVPEDLTQYEIEVFRGIVLDPAQYPEE